LGSITEIKRGLTNNHINVFVQQLATLVSWHVLKHVSTCVSNFMSIGHFGLNLRLQYVKFYFLIVSCVEQLGEKTFSQIYHKTVGRTRILLVVRLRFPVRLENEIPNSSKEIPEPPRQKKKTQMSTRKVKVAMTCVLSIKDIVRYEFSYKTVNQAIKSKPPM
jgi:hypothetical protein